MVRHKPLNQQAISPLLNQNKLHTVDPQKQYQAMAQPNVHLAVDSIYKGGVGRKRAVVFVESTINPPLNKEAIEFSEH